MSFKRSFRRRRAAAAFATTASSPVFGSGAAVSRCSAEYAQFRANRALSWRQDSHLRAELPPRPEIYHKKALEIRDRLVYNIAGRNQCSLGDKNATSLLCSPPIMSFPSRRCPGQQPSRRESQARPPGPPPWPAPPRPSTETKKKRNIKRHI